MFSVGRGEGGRDRKFVECLAAAEGRGDATENLWSVVGIALSSPLRGLFARPAPNHTVGFRVV